METRNTIQKQMILGAVSRLANHPTAEQVYEEVAVKLPNISRATVYRNLSDMAERGLLRRVPVPGGADHYDHTLAPHYHVRCLQCGALADVLNGYLAQLDRDAGQTTDFTILKHELVFEGLCPNCAAKQQ